MKKFKWLWVGCICCCLTAAIVFSIGQAQSFASKAAVWEADSETGIIGSIPTDTHTLNELISENELRSYTDTDYFDCDCGATDERKNIKDYLFDGHDTTANIKEGKLKDNDITRIIPRVLFENAGEYFYSGKEYGFYVNTRYQYSQDMKFIYPFSHVMVFDIYHAKGESQREIQYRITYLFDRYFSTVSPTMMDTYEFYYDTDTVVSRSSPDSIDPIYIENMMFNMEMKNIYQSSNSAENSEDGTQTLYDIRKDTGMILEQTRINYSARQYNGDRYNFTPLKKTIMTHAIGNVAKKLADKIPVFGDAYKGYKFLKELSKFGDGIIDGIPPRFTEVTANNEANIYTRLSRAEQLEMILSAEGLEDYTGEQNFIRNCVIDLHKIILCQPGDYVELLYVLSDTSEPTAVTESLSFDLTDSKGNINEKPVFDDIENYFDSNYGVKKSEIREFEPYEISETYRLFDREINTVIEPEEEFDGYLIEDSEEYLTVTPSFSSRYLLDCSDPKLVLSVTDSAGNAVDLTGGNAELKKDLTYRIKVRSEASSESGGFRFTLKYNPEKYQNAVLNVNTAAKDSTLLMLDAAEGIVNIGLDASSRITVRLLDEHMNWVAPLIAGEDLVLSAPVGNGRYYIEIVNDHTNEVAVRLVPEASAMQANIDLSNLQISGRRWLEFTPYQTGTYKLNFTGDDRLRLAIYQPNSETELYTTTNSDLTFDAQAGVSYRVKIDALDAETAYANAAVTFAPESVGYGDNRRSLGEKVGYYSFAATTAAVYTFETGNPGITVELLDKTTKPLYVTSSTGSRVIAALPEGEIFIKVSAAVPQAFTLSIGAQARDVANSTAVTDEIPYNNYVVYRLTTDQFSGNYRFVTSGNCGEITLYDRNFGAKGTLEKTSDHWLDSATMYYLKIAGATGTAISFEYWFEPTEIYARRNVMVESSGYFVFNVPIATQYRFTHVGAGAKFGQTSADLQLNYTIMDGQFRLLATKPETYALTAGRYYIYVSGSVDSHFSINYADPTAANEDEFMTASEGMLDDLDFAAWETKNVVFTPTVSGSYEVRLNLGEQDSYLFSFFAKNGTSLTKLNVTKTSDSTGRIEVDRYYTMALAAGKTYVFVLESKMDAAANNFYCSVVRPGAVADSYFTDTGNRSHSLVSASGSETTTGKLAFGNTYRFYAAATACTAAVATPKWTVQIGNEGKSFPTGTLKIPAATAVGTAVTLTLQIDRDVRTFSFTVVEPYLFTARIEKASGCRYVVDVTDEYGVKSAPPPTMSLRANLTEDGSTAYASGTLYAGAVKNEIDLLGLPIFHTIHLDGTVDYGVESRTIEKKLGSLPYDYEGKTWSNYVTSQNWMKMDVSDTALGASVSKTITIPSSVKAINILGRTATYNKIRFNVNTRTEPLIVNLANLRVTGYNTFLSGTSADIDLRVWGTNAVTGTVASAIDVRDLTIEGTGSLDVKTDYETSVAMRVRNLTSRCQTLTVTGGAGRNSFAGGTAIRAAGDVVLQGSGTVTVKGGKGKDGVTGNAGAKGDDSVNSDTGKDIGGAGTSGTSAGGTTAGGIGIDAVSFTVKGSVSVTISGGDGGIGANGGAGGMGGHGCDPTGVHVSGGAGGNGGNGGNGSSGSNGAVAVKATKIDVAAAARNVTLKGGKGGNGGKGGDGGAGGRGGNGHHGATGGMIWGAQRNGGNGGQGGNGGNGGVHGSFGRGGNAYDATTVYNPNGKLSSTAGGNGNYGLYGSGGRGGNGGNGGNWSGAGAGGTGGTGGQGGLAGDGTTRSANGSDGLHGVKD